MEFINSCNLRTASFLDLEVTSIQLPVFFAFADIFGSGREYMGPCDHEFDLRH